MTRKMPKGRGTTKCTIQGYEIICYNKLSSTNEKAKEIAKKCNREKIIVLAEMQTQGKGRMNRKWVSPEGGIWLSLILRPRIRPNENFKLTFIMSSAIAETINSMYKLNAKIKWPNDILVNNKKLCGILTEINTKGDTTFFIVIGVGINANIDLEDFPNALQQSLTSLKQILGFRVKRRLLIEGILNNFEHRYKRLKEGKWSELLQEWKNLAVFLGKHVEVISANESLAGVALDVDDTGALVIKLDDGAVRRIIEGDVGTGKQP